MRGLAEKLVAVIDAVLSPVTLLAAWWLGLVRRAGVHRMPVARAIFRGIGVFPIRDHYYEPLFQPQHLWRSLREPRALPGVDLDVSGQLALLEHLRYPDELRSFPSARPETLGYYYDNEAFGPGDAEVLYAMLRHFKPRRMVEIGSGRSTLMAAAALRRNRELDSSRTCDHVCIEPYEVPWLESLGVRVVRDRVERTAPELFAGLGRDDVLFIDSSHVLRPQGDVVFEYLDLLPRLASGVLIHVHDIYTPRDIPDDWIRERVRFWNEQYLLEAFLSFNQSFRVMAALNQLKHDHYAALAACCPVLAAHPHHEPGSFWMVRV
jgi:predicted O-methyltransferase YrrM